MIRRRQPRAVKVGPWKKILSCVNFVERYIIYLQCDFEGHLVEDFTQCLEDDSKIGQSTNGGYDKRMKAT